MEQIEMPAQNNDLAYEIKDLHFEYGAMSILQMGEQLIGHPSTAVNELVKNSYDADAGKCRVYTQYDKRIENTFFILDDDGLGMDKGTLFKDWLRPSISSKRDVDKEKRVSKIYKRKYLGSKGIGRLAAMALGRYLTVITKTAEEDNYNWLTIDRESFRKDDTLETVNFPGGIIENYKDIFKKDILLKKRNVPKNSYLNFTLNNGDYKGFNEGTIIIIQELDESLKTIVETEFENKNIEDTSLFKSLRDLITPLQLNKVLQDDLIENNILEEEWSIDDGSSTFELNYGINFIRDTKVDKIDFIDIEPSSIISHYDYRLAGIVNKNISVKGLYECKRLPNKEVFDKNYQIDKNYLLDDGKKIRIIDGVSTEKYKDINIGKFLFDIRVYDLDKDAKDARVKLFKVNKVSEINKELKKYLGLKVSKNGFGIKPYGEEGKDWLGLGAKRVQQHKVTIGPNQIIGNIFLFSPQNDALDEQTNREGFFENTAFIVFKKIITGILKHLGQTRSLYRESNNLGRKTQSKHKRPDFKSYLEYLEKYVTDIKVLKKTKAIIKDTETTLDNMEYSLTFSQRLASLGSGLELVYHELSQPIAALGSTETSLRKNISKIPDKNLQKILEKRVRQISGSVETLDELKNSLAPAIGKSLPKKFKPIDTFNKVCYLLHNDFEDNNIEIKIEDSFTKDFEIKSFEYIFWISFLNILNNSIYWLKYVDNNNRRIYFTLENETIVLSNTGPEIPEEIIDIIFNYGITGKKERTATGLGLAFTKNMLNIKGWDILAENRTYGPAFMIKKITET